jgi:lipoprotein-anchoring transpeptidase ErfK/SrfK
VKLVPLIVLLAANLLANQVLAEDASTQPLTRIDCDKSGMAWNDTANVCGASAQVDVLPEKSNVADSVTQPLTRTDCDANNLTWNETANVCGGVPQVAEAAPDAQAVPTEVVDTSGQPLTRADCDKAGMLWNDTANVCEAAHAAEGKSETQDLVNPTALEETAPITSTVLISIDKASQTMTVSLDGVEHHEWPVSTGLRGYTTPSGTYTARSMNKIWYSRQWDNAPMPHAVFFTRDGHAIHGTHEVKRLGKPASHGCVRLSPENAATLFALVEKTGLKNTQVVLAGTTPGGEGKVASQKPRKKQVTRSKSREYTNRFGRRWWFRRYYAAPSPSQPFYMGRPRQRGWR